MHSCTRMRSSAVGRVRGCGVVHQGWILVQVPAWPQSAVLPPKNSNVSPCTVPVPVCVRVRMCVCVSVCAYAHWLAVSLPGLHMVGNVFELAPVLGVSVPAFASFSDSVQRMYPMVRGLPWLVVVGRQLAPVAHCAGAHHILRGASALRVCAVAVADHGRDRGVGSARRQPHHI
jgi:hypothetical protein